jgi:hypothetical protein
MLRAYSLTHNTLTSICSEMPRLLLIFWDLPAFTHRNTRIFNGKWLFFRPSQSFLVRCVLLHFFHLWCLHSIKYSSNLEARFLDSDPPRTGSNIVECVCPLLKAKVSWLRNQHLFARRTWVVSWQTAVTCLACSEHTPRQGIILMAFLFRVLESRIVSVRGGTEQIAVVEAFSTRVRQVTDSNLE